MSQKQFTRKEIESRNHRDDAVFVIDNVVYEVTKFLHEHPGGAESLLDHVGGDATQAFNDVDHSVDAHVLMKQYAVGEVVEAERNHRPENTREAIRTSVAGENGSSGPNLLTVLALPLALAAAVYLYLYVPIF